MSDELLEQQISYYRARASEYDDWFLRRGRYDQGPEWNRRWFSEVEEVRSQLERFGPSGKVLELACGTGLWTERLIRHADSLTAVDASPEVLEINRARVGDERVHYVQTDLFEWGPDALYDVAFFGFWLSHVPPDRFTEFWDLVRSALKPEGRVFFVDSLNLESASSKNYRAEDNTSLRQLSDGREFRIYKVFYEPDELASRLAGMGWNISVKATESYLLYGSGSPKISRTPAP